MAVISTWGSTPIDPTLLNSRGYLDPIVVDGNTYPRVLGYIAAGLSNAVSIIGTGVPGGPAGKSDVAWRVLTTPTPTGNPSTYNMALPNTFNKFRVEFSGLVATIAVQFFVRFSFDGGATYEGTASSYAYTATDLYNTASTIVSGLGNALLISHVTLPNTGISGSIEFNRQPVYGFAIDTQNIYAGVPSRFTGGATFGNAATATNVSLFAVAPSNPSVAQSFNAQNIRLLGAA